jgi:hypothetical protein
MSQQSRSSGQSRGTPAEEQHGPGWREPGGLVDRLGRPRSAEDETRVGLLVSIWGEVSLG